MEKSQLDSKSKIRKQLIKVLTESKLSLTQLAPV